MDGPATHRVHPIFRHPNDPQPAEINDWIKELLHQLKQHEIQINKAIQQAWLRMDNHLAQHSRLWELGQSVMYLWLTPKARTLESKWIVPYTISNQLSLTVVQIDKGVPGKWVHVSQLKLFKGTG